MKNKVLSNLHDEQGKLRRLQTPGDLTLRRSADDSTVAGIGVNKYKEKLLAKGDQNGRMTVPPGKVEHIDYALGIDIGGTKTIVLLMDRTGEVIYRRKFPSHSGTGRALGNIRSQIAEFLDEIPVSADSITATGIGVPAITTPQTGEILSAPGLDEQRVNIIEFFGDYLPGRVTVDNDANMAVQGECWNGIGRGYRNVCLVAIGTGIGTGILLDGNVYRGSTGFAGEIGHFHVDPFTESQIESSGFGPLESVASGKGIERMLAGKLESHPGTALTSSSTTEEVFAAMRDGDRLAQELIEDMVKYLSFAIANIVTVLDPELVIIGGGVAQSGNDFVERISRRLTELSPLSIRLVQGELGEDAAAIGAAAAAIESQEAIDAHSHTLSYK